MRVLVILATIFLIIGGCTQNIKPPDKWEYKVVTIDPMALSKRLRNDKVSQVSQREVLQLIDKERSSFLTGYGEKGWEIIAVDKLTYTFRRPISS